MSSRSNTTKAALILSLVAGVLMLIDGILWLGDPNFYTYRTIPALGWLSQLSNSADRTFVNNFTLGVAGVIFALILFTISYYVYLPGSDEMTGGISMALFSIVSLTTGGGFIIGTILGLVGGMLSIIRRR